jgi:putative peptidoglycan lipid II flippase
MAAILVAVGLTLAKNDLGNLFGEDSPGTTRGSQTTTPTATPIRGVTGSSYDPLGDGSEHDPEAANAVDGDATTVWRTDRYNSPSLGGLKPGVGLVLSLDTPAEASQLNLILTANGADLTVYATDADTIPDQFGDGSGWTEVGKQVDAGAKLNLKLSGGPQRHYLIWFTDLPADGDRYRIGIAEAGLRS